MHHSHKTNAPESIIDWPQAEAILGSGDTELRKIYEDFISCQPAEIGDLRELIGGDASAGEIKEKAHRVKGAVMNFGLEEMGNTLTEIERLAIAGEFDGLPPLVDCLDQLFTSSVMLLEKRFPRPTFS